MSNPDPTTATSTGRTFSALLAEGDIGAHIAGFLKCMRGGAFNGDARAFGSTCRGALKACVQASNARGCQWAILRHLNGSGMLDTGNDWCPAASCMVLYAAHTESHQLYSHVPHESVTASSELPDDITDLALCNLDKSVNSLPALPRDLVALAVSNVNIEHLPAELPERLATLDIRGCKRLSALPDSLPTSLETLVVRECDALPAITTLPDSLQRLAVSSCRNLAELSFPTASNMQAVDVQSCANLRNVVGPLPGTLREFKMEYCPGQAHMPNMPAGMKVVYLGAVRAMETLPSLPENLESLDVRFCAQAKLPNALPSGLRKLTLCYADAQLEALPFALPNNLEYLAVQSYKSLARLPELPDTLRQLNVSHMESLETLPPLPAGLRQLSLGWCSKLAGLAELPTSLRSLSISQSLIVQELPAELPAELQDLTLKFLANFHAWPTLPSTLTQLMVQKCASLEALPDFPDALQKLEIKQCNKLTTLPARMPAQLQSMCVCDCAALSSVHCEFPGTALQSLDLRKCAELRSVVSVLPEGLHELNVSDCGHLSKLPDALPASLRQLKRDGCKKLDSMPEVPPDCKVTP